MGHLLCVLAFALFFLGDANDWRWGKAAPRLCFPAGLALLAAALVLLCRGGRPAWLAGLCGLLGALFLLLLVRTLFFAFPAEEAYARQDTGRPACTRGVYALCRHPGVLWLAGLCLCLWGGFGLPFFTVILVTALNLGLVAFEDCRVFPAKLAGYGAYRQKTPFLIPTAASIRAMGRDLRERKNHRG